MAGYEFSRRETLIPAAANLLPGDRTRFPGRASCVRIGRAGVLAAIVDDRYTPNDSTRSALVVDFEWPQRGGLESALIRARYATDQPDGQEELSLEDGLWRIELSPRAVDGRPDEAIVFPDGVNDSGLEDMYRELQGIDNYQSLPYFRVAELLEQSQ
jgi:hypothetical protein